MSDKESPKNVIKGYRKRQQTAKRAPLILGIAAVLLIVGAAFIIFWTFGPNQLSLALFSSETPTPTNTATVTPTFTPTATFTATPTETTVPTETLTPTPSGPFIYQVLEGDSCYSIAVKFDVGILLLITINNLDPSCPIRPGDQLTIPGPDMELPTPTPLPENLPRGFIIEYQVLPGDTLAVIAIKFNSTVEAIMEENELENENEILAGQILKVPVNLVTPVPTKPPTVLDGATATPTPSG
jgi:LysM repeat protein